MLLRFRPDNSDEARDTQDRPFTLTELMDEMGHVVKVVKAERASGCREARSLTRWMQEIVDLQGAV